jgi:D-sorbitol dehydrogenase (acceptor)
MEERMRLEGKTAIVTGGAQGIGRATAKRFAADGASVVIGDLQEEGAQAVAKEITDAGGQALGIALDVRDQAQVRTVVDRAVEQFGGVDILMNNAGVIRITPFLEITEEEWDLLFDVNCKGLLWCAQAAARQMIKQGRGGKIINVASQAGRRGEPLVLTYCASKATVISMTQSMGLALAEHKINVNAIAPGIVDTPLWESNDRRFAELLGMEVGEPKRTFVKSIPLGRIEQPEDVAGVAAFLASSDADYITQQCYNVDGGNWPS